MGTVLAVLGVLAVLFVAAWVATRDGEVLVDAPPDRADLDLPGTGPLGADALERVRFGMALRGYRMAEVDDLLDRLATELRERDVRLAVLEGHHEVDSDGEPGLPPVHEEPGAEPPEPVPFPDPVPVDEPEPLPAPPDDAQGVRPAGRG